MTVLAVLIGYLLGAIPTAAGLGRIAGVNLRSEGSGNPGANNALRTSGPLLAVAVLVVEAAKGYAAVVAGDWLAGGAGAIAGGLGAVAGNVYNVWYRFEGGKGLGISFGVLAAIWPAVLLPVVVVTYVGVRASGGSSGVAALGAIAFLVAMAALWAVLEWPTGGIEPGAQLFVVAVGIGIIIFQRHWRDATSTAPGPP